MDATSIMEFVKEAVTTEVFGVWFLIGAALVFFMQAAQTSNVSKYRLECDLL